MAKDRLSLHNLLLSLVPSGNVYFQPPQSVHLKYPCIVYKLDDVTIRKANDQNYLQTKRYLITVIDQDPDSAIYDKILKLQYSTFESHFASDNLNHYICSLHW